MHDPAVVRRLLIERLGLTARADLTPAALVRKLEAVQIDPVNLVARNHELVFFNRLRRFAVGQADYYCGEERVFEYIAGNRALRYIFLASRVFPPISLIIPIFLMVGWIRLYDTVLAQVIVNTYMWLPFYIWINIGFFDTIPRELDQAAQLDGCSRMQSFLRIAFPLALPGVAASSIIAFLGTWNEFLYNLILGPTPRSKNLSVGASDFIADMFVSWNQMAAGAIIACLPAIIFVVFFQRYIVKGLTSGAVKG